MVSTSPKNIPIYRQKMKSTEWKPAAKHITSLSWWTSWPYSSSLSDWTWRGSRRHLSDNTASPAKKVNIMLLISHFNGKSLDQSATLNGETLKRGMWMYGCALQISVLTDLSALRVSYITVGFTVHFTATGASTLSDRNNSIRAACACV